MIKQTEIEIEFLKSKNEADDGVYDVDLTKHEVKEQEVHLYFIELNDIHNYGFHSC